MLLYNTHYAYSRKQKALILYKSTLSNKIDNFPRLNVNATSLKNPLCMHARSKVMSIFYFPQMYSFRLGPFSATCDDARVELVSHYALGNWRKSRKETQCYASLPIFDFSIQTRPDLSSFFSKDCMDFDLLCDEVRVFASFTSHVETRVQNGNFRKHYFWQVNKLKMSKQYAL